MFHTVTAPCLSAYALTNQLPPLLPETSGLLRMMQTAWTARDLQTLVVSNPCRTASYRATPERNLPFLWFSIAEADPNLLAFTGKTAPGFEVLQVQCGGFQYHWRSDLMRAMEEETPLVGRLYGSSDTRELVVEHVVRPILSNRRVQEIYGWFIFSQELNSCEEWASPHGAPAFRRSERPKPVRLPRAVSRQERGGVLTRSVLGAIRTKWRPFGGEGRPGKGQ